MVLDYCRKLRRHGKARLVCVKLLSHEGRHKDAVGDRVYEWDDDGPIVEIPPA